MRLIYWREMVSTLPMCAVGVCKALDGILTAQAYKIALKQAVAGL